jgi:hypothetical protein
MTFRRMRGSIKQQGSKFVDSIFTKKTRLILFTGMVWTALGPLCLLRVPPSRGAPPEEHPFEIVVTGLPSAATGVMYEMALRAEGGLSPHTWSLAGGNLPPGMALDPDGTVRGTTIVPGMFPITAIVTDSSDPPAILSATYVLEVVNSEFANNVVWFADFETADIVQWFAPSLEPLGKFGGAQFNSGSGYSLPTQHRSRSGQWGLEMTVATPPMSATRMFRWREPQTYQSLYYSVWYYFPQQYSVTRYWNVFQWKSKISVDQNDPFFILNVGNRPSGEMFFYLYDWQRRRSHWQTWKNIPVGQWLKIDGYYVCTGISAGRLTIWQDGALLFDLNNVQTRYVNGDCQWSVDNYSDEVIPSPSTFFVDDASITLRLPWASGE